MAVTTLMLPVLGRSCRVALSIAVPEWPCLKLTFCELAHGQQSSKASPRASSRLPGCSSGLSAGRVRLGAAGDCEEAGSQLCCAF